MDVRRGQGRPESAARRTVLMSGLAVVALMVVGLAACGGDDGGTARVASLDEGSGAVGTSDGDGGDGEGAGTSDAPTDPEEAMLAFAQCMREHGVDMPDPEASGVGMAFSLGDDIDIEALDAAHEACEPLMANATRDIELDPEREAEMREQMLAFAECMREHGVDMPDPTFQDDGAATIRAEVGDDAPPPDDHESGAFEAAAEECGGGMSITAHVREDG